MNSRLLHGAWLLIGFFACCDGLRASQVELISKADPSLILDAGGGFAQGVPKMSADGRYVVFSSSAPNLVPGQIDNNGQSDIFLYDRVGDTITLVSHTVASALSTGNLGASNFQISADGNFVVFQTSSSDLGFTDSDLGDQVILFERATGDLTLVSRSAASATTAGNNSAYIQPQRCISSDGRYVAYSSYSSDLGFTDTNGNSDVFLYDRQTGTTALASRTGVSATTTGNGESSEATVSSDGAYVAYRSSASNLGFTDGNSAFDVLVFDRAAGTNALASHTSGDTGTAANGTSLSPSIASDGAFIAFQSTASNMGFADTNGKSDVFVFERGTGALTLASSQTGFPSNSSNGLSQSPALSADGNFVAYNTTSTDLGFTDGNGTQSDVVLFDRVNGTNTLVSRNSSSATETGNGLGFLGGINSDGSRVVFLSTSTDLGFTDANGSADALLFKRADASLTLLSRSSASATTAGNGAASDAAVCGDGTFAAFLSNGTNLGAVAGPQNAVWQFDLAAGTNALVNRRDPLQPSDSGNAVSSLERLQVCSSDGRYAVFVSSATNLVDGQVDANNDQDVFLHDRQTGQMTLVSRSTASATQTANLPSYSPRISSDGNFVTFASEASDLIATDANAAYDCFLFDRVSGLVTLVSHASGSLTTPGAGASLNPSISVDGRFVAFESTATDLIATDGNGSSDVFLYDRNAPNTIVLISHASGAPNTPADAPSYGARISEDGAFVAFSTSASNLGFTDTNGTDDIVLWERSTGNFTLVSRNGASASTTGNGGTNSTRISADGRIVAFESSSTNLGFTDTNFTQDVFLFDRTTGQLALVSRTGTSASTAANQFSTLDSLSADGKSVGFSTFATNMGFTDSNGGYDAFVFDRQRGTNELISGSSASVLTASNGASNTVQFSEDGRYAAFTSTSTDLGDFTDPNGALSDAFLMDRLTGKVTLVGRSSASATTTGNLQSIFPYVCADGTFVYFESSASDLVDNDFNAGNDIFSFAVANEVSNGLYAKTASFLINWAKHGSSIDADKFVVAGNLNPRGMDAVLSGATVTVLLNGEAVVSGLPLSGTGLGTLTVGSEFFKFKIKPSTGAYSFSAVNLDLRNTLGLANVAETGLTPIKVQVLLQGAGLVQESSTGTFQFSYTTTQNGASKGKFAFLKNRTLSGVMLSLKTTAAETPGPLHAITAKGPLVLSGGGPVVPTGSVQIALGTGAVLTVPFASLDIVGLTPETKVATYNASNGAVPGLRKFSINNAKRTFEVTTLGLALTGIPQAGPVAATAFDLDIVLTVNAANGPLTLQTTPEIKRTSGTTTKWKR